MTGVKPQWTVAKKEKKTNCWSVTVKESIMLTTACCSDGGNSDFFIFFLNFEVTVFVCLGGHGVYCLIHVGAVIKCPGSSKGNLFWCEKTVV